MNEQAMETLAGRLDRVERENRWLKQAGVVVLAVMVAVVLMGQVKPQSRTIETEKLIIKDEKGVIRVKLALRGLMMYDRNGKIKVELSNFPGVGSTLALTHPGEKGGVVVGAHKVKPFISLFNKAGKVIWSAP